MSKPLGNFSKDCPDGNLRKEILNPFRSQGPSKRVLNHYAERNLSHAYSFLLIAWFRQQGVAIPNGLLSADPLSGGSGAKQNSHKLTLGARALEAHIEKLSGGGFSPEAVHKAYAQPPGRCASKIAKMLLPSEYESNRDAARKRIEEAIEAFQKLPRKAAGELLAKLVADDLVKMLLSGTFPLGSNLSEIFVSLQQTLGATEPRPEASIAIAPQSTPQNS